MCNAALCCRIDLNHSICAECRVLLLLAEGPIDPNRPGGDELYDFFRQAVDWCARLPEGHTFKVEARAWACSSIPTSLLMQARRDHAVRQASLVLGNVVLSYALAFTDHLQPIRCSGEEYVGLCHLAALCLAGGQWFL